MVTIYFDKQFFSYLFNAKEEKYIILRDKILSHKDDFVFFIFRCSSIGSSTRQY